MGTITLAGLLVACSDGPVTPVVPDISRPSYNNLAVPSTQVVSLKLVSIGNERFYNTTNPQTGPAVGPFVVQGLSPSSLGTFNAFCIDYVHNIGDNVIWDARIIPFDEVVSNPTYLAAALRVLGSSPWNGSITALRQSAYLADQFALFPTGSWTKSSTTCGSCSIRARSGAVLVLTMRHWQRTSWRARSVSANGGTSTAN